MQTEPEAGSLIKCLNAEPEPHSSGGFTEVVWSPSQPYVYGQVFRVYFKYMTLD